MIKFEFTLDDEESIWLFDLLHEEKCRISEAKGREEIIEKNIKMVKYYENQLKYLANMRKKMLDGQNRLDNSTPN